MTTITLTLMLIFTLTIVACIFSTKQRTHCSYSPKEAKSNRELHQKLHKSVGSALFLIR